VTITILRMTGEKLRQYLPELARLRIEVFKDYPYLYEGSLDYEQKYLARYVKARTGTIVIALDGEQIVGASTALALEEEDDYIIAPFRQLGMDISKIFYFGESVLLSQYRGQGIGVKFFAEREAAARQGGFLKTYFCAVKRPEDHPLRPQAYQPLDNFWQKRGYKRCPELVASFSWKDLGDEQETIKPMVYWMKELDS